MPRIVVPEMKEAVLERAGFTRGPEAWFCVQGDKNTATISDLEVAQCYSLDDLRDLIKARKAEGNASNG